MADLEARSVVRVNDNGEVRTHAEGEYDGYLYYTDFKLAWADTAGVAGLTFPIRRLPLGDR